MQGFYEYKLYGNNEELKKALEMVELLSTTNKDFKYLYGDCRGISEDYFSKKKRKVLTFTYLLVVQICLLLYFLYFVVVEPMSFVN